MVLLICAFCAGSGGEVTAQIGLRTGVFATGGGMMSNGTYAAAGTIGQSVIGRSIGTTFAASAGFWGDGGVILDVEGPTAAEIPAEFALRQNYPNPFNPGTMITYALPVEMEVQLRVYDLLGRELAMLADERMPAGIHSVRFDGAGLASGVYVYRLTAGDFIQSRRMMLLK
jgi:hypothetical protein